MPLLRVPLFAPLSTKKCAFSDKSNKLLLCFSGKRQKEHSTDIFKTIKFVTTLTN